jgi:hypothetical protein
LLSNTEYFSKCSSVVILCFLSPRVESFSKQVRDVCSIPKQRTLFCLQTHVYMLVSMLIARLFCSACFVRPLMSTELNLTCKVTRHASLNQLVGMAKRLTLALAWGIRVIHS